MKNNLNVEQLSQQCDLFIKQIEDKGSDIMRKHKH